MNFSPPILYPILTCLILLTSSPTVLAYGKGTQALGIKLEQFVIRPLNCVTQYMGQECQLAISLVWQTDKPTDLCFYQKKSQLACWQNTQRVSQGLTVKLQNDSEFTLQHTASGVTLARQVVKITFLNKYRRTLRPQWSIF